MCLQTPTKNGGGGGSGATPGAPLNAPPATKLSKVPYSAATSIKKDKTRENSSRFNVSQDRELTKLPNLSG